MVSVGGQWSEGPMVLGANSLTITDTVTGSQTTTTSLNQDLGLGHIHRFGFGRCLCFGKSRFGRLVFNPPPSRINYSGKYRY